MVEKMGKMKLGSQNPKDLEAMKRNPQAMM